MNTGLFEAIWVLVRTVPAGKVTTYGDVAKALGNPRLSRTVGFAMHDAPEDVPCQRVVNRFGGLSDAFSPLGKESHRLLLELEDVPFRGDGTVDLTLCRYEF